ncbi:Fanconi anaemia protein FancD2 nuclease-domain-containing protein [Gongronella butleri]|nr:Fanconi anaemia protein FancD2 nuclease-domain-containing protein [Gongronella butleri]
MDECKYAFRYLSAFQDNMPQFKTAVCLYKTLERMMHLSCSTQHLRKGTQRVASEILARDWFDWRDCSKEIPFLLEKTIELSEDPLSLLNQYVNVVLPAFEREGRLADHPLLSKHTVVSYYQAMINQATKLLVLLDSTDQEVEAVLARTAEVVKIFAAITQYVKSKEQRALFALLLKSSRFFVDQFIKHSIPFFTKAFKEYHAEIAPIFSTFQLATRPLQILCSHVKVKKDLQLAAFVPPLKRALEIVIYQVKILLSENNAPTDVFFLGSLKHRDLHGAMVSSQIPKEDSDDESNDELNSSLSDDDDVPMTSRRAAAASKTKKAASKPRNTGKETGKRKSGSVPDRPPRTNSQIRDSDEDDSDDNVREESDSEMPLIHQLSSSAPRKRAPSTASDTADEDDDDDDGPPASPIPRTSQTSYGSRVVSPIGEDYDDEHDENDDAPRSPAKRTVSKIFDLSKPSTASASKYFGNQADSTPKKRYGMSAPRKRPKNDNPSDRSLA